ncbi:lactonase family protein [Pontibacter anaerobius]|uniref:Lactonase family protein n=1 Tax=Pontibacter anaerobius TaxID=2993940 RepID=A0ABT3RDX2_9BACT|nr:lactonase family protein [Pontibacter anaerobius]MCX2739465.1 lactonase family protein [Pontibacter anaerobius]
MHKLFNLDSRKLVNRTALALTGVALAMAGCNTATEQQDAATTATAEPESMKATTLYVGSYADPDAESIYLYSLNPETGELTRESSFKAGANPSYLTLDNAGKYLYAVNETQDFEGKKSGAVSAFSVSDGGKNLTLLNRVASEGGAPCYISLQDSTVLVANYMGGNVAALPVQQNGQLGQANMVQHEGTGPNKERQNEPHAHYIAPSPDGKYSFAVDLGADKVFGYKVEEGKLVPHNPAIAYAAAPGSGPRHMVFHPNGRYAYLLHELNSTVTAMAYDADKGTFSEKQTLTTLPEGFEGDSYPAAVKVSADGKYLYTSNRGHNSITVFAISEDGGNLTPVQHMSTGGDWPRDFSIDPSGNILLVANERSNNITSFKIDKATGKLTATGHETQVHKPVNLVFR